MQIQIPHNYTPRDYQLPLIKAVDNGYTRSLAIWHRRAGKDKTLVNLIIKKAFERVGVYYYFFPTYAQGRKILWEGIDKDGFRFLNHIPQELIISKNDTEMKIELKNGSIFRVVGTDKIDSIVGTNPIGCVFSEYSLQNPQAWAFIRPILQENGGWAVFNYTPRGDNHGKLLYTSALKRDDWYVEKLTAVDTGVFTPEQLEREKRELIEEHGEAEGVALFEQEYMCSFDAPVQGSYYGQWLQQIERENRIINLPYDSSIPVHTAWDLGVGDATAIWFYQLVANEIRIIDFFEAQGEGLQFYANELNKKGYAYGNHFAPHDIQVRELGSGLSRLETARNFGINFQVVPLQPLDDGINAVRSILNRCWFDETKTEYGYSALKNYRKEFDEKRKTYKDHPLHDWSSHASDAFRYLATSLREDRPRKPKTPKKYDPITGRLIS